MLHNVTKNRKIDTVLYKEQNEFLKTYWGNFSDSLEKGPWWNTDQMV